MRSWGTIAVLGALLLTGCGAPSVEEAPASEPATNEQVEAAEAPDVIGLPLDVARDTLREAGVKIVDEIDVDEERTIWKASNWTVVEQSVEVDGVVLHVMNHAEAEREAAEEKHAVADAERSTEVEAAIKAALGVSDFSELFVQDPTLWGGWITDVRVEGSHVYVTLQVGPDDPARDDLGGRAARALTTLLPSDALDGISWIVVEDATRVVIAQEMV